MVYTLCTLDKKFAIVFPPYLFTFFFFCVIFFLSFQSQTNIIPVYSYIFLHSEYFVFGSLSLFYCCSESVFWSYSCCSHCFYMWPFIFLSPFSHVRCFFLIFFHVTFQLPSLSQSLLYVRNHITHGKFTVCSGSRRPLWCIPPHFTQQICHV